MSIPGCIVIELSGTSPQHAPLLPPFLHAHLQANILTGLVNMSLDTLAASPPQAMGILLVYLLVVCGVALTLHAHRIRLK